MGKRLPIIIFIFLFALSGCGSPLSKTPIQIFKETNNTGIKSDSDTKQKPTDTVSIPENSKDGNLAVTAKPVEIQEPTQPEPSSDKKMDFNLLDKLDNTKYAWWITLNKEHKPTGIPTIAKSLIEKYSGIYIGDTSKKVVYLTFDEGYENGFTPKILDTLKEDQVKTIFFVTGFFMKDHADLVKRMISEGHLVGDHTISHPSLPTVSDQRLENELYGLEKQFTQITGKGIKYMRPPMGDYSEKVLAAAQRLGYKTVFWSYAYADFDVNNQKGADHAYKTVMDNLHNGAVILLHAVSKDNAEALDRIIKGIRSEGYEIKQLDL
jgi:peptidoglycan-N-acetylmuramic acid deacetylase